MKEVQEIPQTNYRDMNELMQKEILSLVQTIHTAPNKLAYVCAGAGTDALSGLFVVAGASKTVLECRVPYSKASFVEFLGKSPEKFVSKKTALQLAGRALTRAQLLSEENSTPLIGVSCTATIVTDRPKRGLHHAFVATWQAEKIVAYHLILEKNVRNRAEEESVVSLVVLNAIANAVGLEVQLHLNLREGDQLDKEVVDVSKEVGTLFTEERSCLAIHESGEIQSANVEPEVLLSGSFNPLHAGHLGMATAASKHLNKPVAFEISVYNVDKPPLEKKIVLKRTAQFAGQHAIYLSDAPTFVGKTRVYGATTFIVGYDTARRIVNSRYYNNSEQEMLDGLNEMMTVGTHFLVADRVEEDGKVYSVEGLEMDEVFRPLFSRLPDFRHDISSSSLRKAGLKGSR